MRYSAQLAYKKSNWTDASLASHNVLQSTYSITAALKKSHPYDSALLLLVREICTHVGVLALQRVTLGCSYHRKKWTENVYSVIKNIFELTNVSSHTKHVAIKQGHQTSREESCTSSSQTTVKFKILKIECSRFSLFFSVYESTKS